ncbi:hypothetical protein E8L90_28885 [Brevibacillus antibioticus]|uniref:Uncharacterized protein n=2 Tax=Brevibacillus antibioticus TaxID=2570228 RepID=A0A4U2YEQ6_9BACL|nr:hypothetical protein E8L90_28885 [Brevibacillus antibioticus]
MISALTCTICFTGILTAPLPQTQAEAATHQITYKLPPNPEKYLFLNKQMVSITNPQPRPLKLRPYSSGDFISDMHGGDDPQSLNKMYYSYNLKFQTSKKGFLWNVYDFIGTLPPAYPADVNLDELDNRIRSLERLTSEDEQVIQRRAQIHMDARLKPLIQAGYVMPNEIDDERATKEFVATVLYRMFGTTRPYHGGIDLKDSENVAVRWAVEVGLPGFEVDKEGYIYPQSPLSMDPGPNEYGQEYAYDRLFHFITLVLPGKKTAGGWEYYQVKLLDGMLPVQLNEFIHVNGKPYKDNQDSSINETKEYQNARGKISQYFVPRFPKMLELARKDAMKPRAWEWSRDFIHHPKFAKQVAAYRKNKSSKNVDAVYQALRQHYNLNTHQDSPAIIKSVLDNVK